MSQDSENLAKSYSHSLSKASEAFEVVNELLEDKLMVASRTISLNDERYSNELLKELATTLEVDEINVFNPQGKIIYSNRSGFIGWKANEGHPVYDFMNSNNISHVEDIRPSTQTGVLYKYGYFRASDGSFVQIGVMSAKIQDLLGQFKMQYLLHEMQNGGIVTQIIFIDINLNIIGSTDNQLIGQEITSKKAKSAILESKKYGFITDNDGEKEYRVYVPIYSGKSKIGTMAISQSLKETETVVRKVTIISLFTLIIIFALLFYIMISANKKNKQLIQMAYYDTLTGLPNIQYLKELLTEEIEKKTVKKRALLIINCSNFRIINLTYGYEYGDELLKKLSEKIQGLVNNNKKLFRFSDEKFGLFIEKYDSKEDLVSITNRISQMFNKPFKVKDSEQNLAVEIGIVEINSHYDKVDRILKVASISLNHVKDNDSVNYAFFNEVMESRLQREGLIEKELRLAIIENDTTKLYLEFQPQVDLKTNKVTCFEALARMRTESLGFISPFEFIDVAEKKQLIIPLGNFILKTACDFIRTLKAEGYGGIKVAVNISGIQLLQDDFTDTVMDIIKKTDIEESNLELEITESVLLDNYEVINKKLKNFRDLKIGIALDDFGTGYSSFSRLAELSIDTVKIDKYFIDKIASKEPIALITGDIISMSHKQGHTVVAEGVELQAQMDYLIENDCDIIQGYFFSKPLLEKDAIELLKSNIT